MATGKKKVREGDETQDYGGWWVHVKYPAHVHYVNAVNARLCSTAMCGLHTLDRGDWQHPKGNEHCCAACQNALAKAQQMRAPDDPHERAADAMFMQVVGPVIPLCWIPVADIQMVVKLLHQHMPESTLRASRAQFQGVIDALNTYVGEALDRNAKANMPSSFTYTDCAKTGRVKK